MHYALRHNFFNRHFTGVGKSFRPEMSIHSLNSKGLLFQTGFYVSSDLIVAFNLYLHFLWYGSYVFILFVLFRDFTVQYWVNRYPYVNDYFDARERLVWLLV